MNKSKDLIDKINRILNDNYKPDLVIVLSNTARSKVDIKSIVEGKTLNYKGIQVRVDPANSQMGIPRHAHTDYKGKQISYNDNRQRHHPGKFPNQVPAVYKDAIKWALKLGPDIELESYAYYDELINELSLLIEDIT